MAAEATATAVTTNKAGFWVRFFAILIDGIGVSIVSNIISGFSGSSDPLDPARSSINTLIGILYFCYFWSGQGGGQTLGMRVLNIKVVRTDGASLTLLQAFVRYIGLFVSIVCLFIGVIWAAFDANKQGWHDKIASTYVIRV
ncbi:MAG TPA: RDD family protein [Candidatus Limnocylindria bacterium]|nr:RDD family protein [Candidatus Limnocylindria bacterium]